MKCCYCQIEEVEPRQIFGMNLNRIRNAEGMTQNELAEKANLDRSYLQKIEHGTSMPTVEVAVRLKKSLGCSWEDLTKGME